MIILHHVGECLLTDLVADLRTHNYISGKIDLLCIPVCKYIYIIVQEKQISVVSRTVLMAHLQITSLINYTFQSVWNSAHVSSTAFVQHGDYSRRRKDLHIRLPVLNRNFHFTAQLTVSHKYMRYILVVAHKFSLENNIYQLARKLRFDSLWIKEFVIYNRKIVIHTPL